MVYTKTEIVSIFTCVFFLVSSGYAAVIIDTPLVTSPPTNQADLINPAGYTITEATGSTPEATLETISGLMVIQDYSADLTGGTNVFAFIDTAKPDIKISFSSGVTSSTGVRLANSGFLTSASDSMRIQGSREGQFTMTIDFGSWDGTSFSSTGNAVDAAAFTLYGLDNEFSNFQADFLDDAGNTLSSQNTGLDAYFGYQTTGNGISSIVVTFSPISSNDGPLGFDDLAFAVPEPASALLLIAGSVCVANRR